MANNYCLSSTIYPLTEDQKKRAEEIIHEVGIKNAAEWDGIKPGDEGYDDLEPQVEFAYDMNDRDGIWMHHDESVNPDLMADVIARFQVEFKATKPFCFEYCCECSKPRVDEFAGGSFCIMPDGSQYHSGNREDSLEKAKQAGQFGKVVWTIEDVKTLKPDWTDEAAKEWFADNEKHLQSRLVELGWQIMEDLM